MSHKQALTDIFGEWGASLTEKKDRWVIELFGDLETALTFANLAKLAEVFDSRKINIGFEEGGPLSEVTWDPSRHWITIYKRAVEVEK